MPVLVHSLKDRQNVSLEHEWTGKASYPRGGADADPKTAKKNFLIEAN